MIGSLWYCGVAIDPGRLIDDVDPAYTVTVLASYQRFLDLRAEEQAQREAEEAKARQTGA